MAAVDAGLHALFADCDGAVAADSLQVERSALDGTIPANGRIQTHTKHYPGTNSQTGCGGNSDYYVTQSVIRTYEGDPAGPQTGRLFIIGNRSSGLVLDVPGGTHSAGVQIQQFADNGTLSQHWQLIPTDSGYYMIRSALNGLVLEVAGDSTADHAHIQQAAWTGEKNQHWMFEPVSVPTADLPFPVLPSSVAYYRIRSRSSSKVMDVPSASASPVGIQQFTQKSSNFDNQLWQLLPLTAPPPTSTTGEPPIVIP
jgi:Ricin-type beta-trefoil lectin domain-like